MLVGPKWASRFLGHSYMGRMHQPPFPLGRSLKRPFLEHIPIGQRARRRRASSVSPPAGSPRCESSALFRALLPRCTASRLPRDLISLPCQVQRLTGYCHHQCLHDEFLHPWRLPIHLFSGVFSCPDAKVCAFIC